MSLLTNTTKLNELKNKANNLPDQNPPAQLQEKTVTPTKEGLSVAPDSGFDGLSKVTVNGDNNLVPENIKEGVSIFGVAGSMKIPKYHKIIYDLGGGHWADDYTPPTMYLEGERTLLPNNSEVYKARYALNGFEDEDTGGAMPYDSDSSRQYIPAGASKDYKLRAIYV